MKVNHALGCQGLNELDSFAQRLAQIDWFLGKRKSLRFDPRKVEHFVDEIEQMPASAQNVVDRFALITAELFQFQQLSKAKNGVHRRAQFVAHSGKELALGAVGAISLFFRFLQRFLCARALGDVVRHREREYVGFRPGG